MFVNVDSYRILIRIICSNGNNHIPNSSRWLTVATTRTKVKQDMQCKYNVTLRSVHATIVDVKKQ